MSLSMLNNKFRSLAVLGGFAAGAIVLGAAPRAAAPRALPASAPLEALQAAQQETLVSSGDLRYTGARAQALMEAFEKKLDYIPGDVLVKFRDGTTIGGAQRALSSLRSQPDVNELAWIGDVARLHDASTGDSRLLAQKLSEQPEVLYAEVNHLNRLPSNERTGFTAPAGTGPAAAPSVTATDPSYASRQWNFPEIGVDRAWGINPGGSSSVIVAVIDTGVTNVNQTFSFPMWNGSAIRNFAVPAAINPDLTASSLVKGRDFVLFNAGTPVLDGDSHGTHVASTIAEATNNGLGLAGLAYNVQIMPIKVCTSYWDVQIIRSSSNIPGYAPLGSGGCPDDAIIAGMRYAADNGARVANMSLGGNSANALQRDALAYMVSKGVFVSISMGNNFEQGNATNYPAQYASTIDGAMSVASTGRSRTKAYYSATGSYSEITAPGGSTRDGSNGSGLIWQMTVRQSDIDENNLSLLSPRYDRYEEVGLQGTSMASPHVAGLAALIVSQIPTITPAGIEQILRSTALDIGTAGKDDQFGYGLIQARAALFGYGGRK